MKKSTIIGIIVTIIAGTLLHFTYEWSGQNPIVGLFSAVNESTWEHLKLLFFPYLIYTIYEYRAIGHQYPNYFTAKAVGILAGLISIPVIFYTYTGILGTNYLALDILTFILAVIISYAVSYFMLKQESFSYNTIGIVILLLLMIAFFVFTFNPPETELFACLILNATI